MSTVVTLFWSLRYLLIFFLFVCFLAFSFLSDHGWFTKSTLVTFSLFFFPFLSGFTGVAPAKKSPKLVSSCFLIFFSSPIHPSLFCPPSTWCTCQRDIWLTFTASPLLPHLQLSSVRGNLCRCCGFVCRHGMLCCAGVAPCSFTSVPPPLWRGLGRGALMHSVSWVANTLMIVSRWVLSLQSESWMYDHSWETASSSDICCTNGGTLLSDWTCVC